MQHFSITGGRFPVVMERLGWALSNPHYNQRGSLGKTAPVLTPKLPRGLWYRVQQP